MHCRKGFSFGYENIGVCLEEIKPKWEVSHLCAFKQWFGLNDKKEMDLEPVSVKSVFFETPVPDVSSERE